METNKPRILWHIAALLLTIANIILFGTISQAQYIPSVFAPDNAVLQAQNQTLRVQLDVKTDSLKHERRRNQALFDEGKKAIAGLQSDLDRANDTIRIRNVTIRQVIRERDQQQARADSAQVTNARLTTELGDQKGRTVVGQWLRKARDGLAVVGGAVFVGIVIKIALL